MTPVTVRNPSARAIRLIVVGLAVGLISLLYFLSHHDENGGSLLAVWLWLFLPCTLGFVLAGLLSIRAMVVVGPDGIHHNGLFEKRHYRWDEVSSVRVVATRHSINLIPTGTTYEMRVYTTKRKERELPAPHAGRLGGRAEFQRSARTLHDAVATGKALAARQATSGT